MPNKDDTQIVNLDQFRSEHKSLHLDPWDLSQLSDSRLKRLILLGFLLCFLASIGAGAIKLSTSAYQDSEREAIGLVTSVMSGITVIAAGVFTGGALR